MTLPQVLIIDDNPGFRKTIKKAFHQKDFYIVEAGSVKQGMDRLVKNPDLGVILLDLKLPGVGGIQFLKNIQARSDCYRVIVLTGHEEMLDDESADTFDVFAYHSKIEELPTTSLRFTIRKALRELESGLPSLTPAPSLDNILGYQFPSPFCAIFEELQSTLSPMKRLFRQMDFFELLLQFQAYVLVAGFLKSSRCKNQNQITSLVDKLAIPSMGSLLNASIFISKNLDPQKNTILKPFIEALRDGSQIKKYFNQLVQLRNNYRGHGTTQTNFEYTNAANEHNQVLMSLLKKYSFLKDYPPVLVLSTSKVKDQNFHRLIECRGLRNRLLETERSFKTFLPSQELLLLDADENYLSLYPFVLVTDCPQCGRKEMFFFSKMAENTAKYLSFDNGHMYTSASLFMELKELFSRVAKDEKEKS